MSRRPPLYTFGNPEQTQGGSHAVQPDGAELADALQHVSQVATKALPDLRCLPGATVLDYFAAASASGCLMEIAPRTVPSA
jgi:hypothetical protein